MIQKVLILSIILTLMACSKNPPQYPTSYSSDGFMEYSKQYAKQLNDYQKELFLEYMDENPGNYIQTNAGFFMEKVQSDSIFHTQENDTLIYSYQVADLQNKTIYTFDDIGEINAVMGKSRMIRGIEYGLKRMGKGDQSKLLIPSTLAYGTDGDRDKIGTDTPIVITLKLIDLKK